MLIGELARRAGVATSRIRFYESHQVLPRAVRRGNGYREYPDSTLKLLNMIVGAQALGFSLGEIRSALGEAAPGVPSHAALVRALEAKLGSLNQHIKKAQVRRRRIVSMLEEMRRKCAAPTAMGGATRS
jgi:DNA-binding transcriptional MerR regulator